MRRILTILFASLSLVAAWAVPAYPGLMPYTQPDGSMILIRQQGDEFFHWTTDASGQMLELGADGYYHPADDSVLEARRAAGSIRRAAANSARRASANAPVAIGQKHFLVILVEFSNVYFASSTAKKDFSDQLNKHNYSANGSTGSARDFYYDNSGGVFEPIFDVYGPVRLDETQYYYGANRNNADVRPHYAVKEGCQKLDNEIDFSNYDLDNDGDVDLIFMYYAGKGEADGGGTNTIWPHQWELTSGGISLTLDGKRLNSYACTNEIVNYGDLRGKMCGIGTACHEFGHAMGLPDFYDVDGSKYNGEAGGLYDYSTMCNGSYNNNGRTPPYFNIEERIMLGWLKPNIYREFTQPGTYTLSGVNGNVAYRSLTDMNDEYFVYECRSKTGWDRYIPEPGLIVYHVDKSSRMISIYPNGSEINVNASYLWKYWQMFNCINENGSHPCFYLVPAGAQSSLRYLGGSFAFPGTGTTKYKSFTATSWNGVESDVHLTDILYSDDKVTLTVSVPPSSLDCNVIDNPGMGIYSAGSSFALNLLECESQPVSSVDWYFDEEPVSGPSVLLSAGTHLVEAHITLTTGESQIISLTIQAR